eukprot:jgi/Mesvir1/24607/Mv21924-RA.1
MVRAVLPPAGGSRCSPNALLLLAKGQAGLQAPVRDLARIQHLQRQHPVVAVLDQQAPGHFESSPGETHPLGGSAQVSLPHTLPRSTRAPLGGWLILRSGFPDLRLRGAECELVPLPHG